MLERGKGKERKEGQPVSTAKKGRGNFCAARKRQELISLDLPGKERRKGGSIYSRR